MHLTYALYFPTFTHTHFVSLMKYSRLNIEQYDTTAKIFLEINLTFLIDLFISYFNLL